MICPQVSGELERDFTPKVSSESEREFAPKVSSESKRDSTPKASSESERGFTPKVSSESGRRCTPKVSSASKRLPNKPSKIPSEVARDSAKVPSELARDPSESARVGVESAKQQLKLPWKITKCRVPLPKREAQTQKTRGQMRPQGMATSHPAFHTLQQYATKGCPAKTGRHWTKEEMQAAIDRGNHISARQPEAVKAYQAEIQEKIEKKQAKIILWDDIKDNPPKQLKISPLAMVPHKSRLFRAILDLSFSLKMSTHQIPSVNESTEKTSPNGTLDQMGTVLPRVIAAVAQTAEGEVVYFAKYDIKDGFWRLECEEGAKYNFAYVMPQEEGQPIKLVVPTSLQMGWTESPSYFNTASETARDVAEEYAKADKLDEHYLEEWTKLTKEYEALPSGKLSSTLAHCFEVFVDDFIAVAVPHTKEDLNHLSRALLHAIHDVFPASPETPEEDPVALKKLKKMEGAWAVRKDILGWVFDGKAKTMELMEDKRDELLSITKKALRAKRGVPFNSFEKMLGKMRRASEGIPGSNGLFSPFNRVLARKPRMVWFKPKGELAAALRDWRAIFKEALSKPTHVKQLIRDPEPDVGGIVDASGEGVGGVIFGMKRACTPTVFRFKWPISITSQLQTESNPTGRITNSDLEMAGLVFLWLAMEHIVGDLKHKHILLLSDNSPSVSWVDRMASKRSLPAAELLRVLALRINAKKACPITPLHIPGVHNRISDIPSRSFGYKREWKFDCDKEFLTFFNSKFPLPQQNSWQMCQMNTEISSRILQSLLTPGSGMQHWRRLPEIGKNIGGTGASLPRLWEWILSLTREKSPTKRKQGHSQSLEQLSEKEFMATVNKSLKEQLAQQSPPLARRSPWMERMERKTL